MTAILVTYQLLCPGREYSVFLESLRQYKHVRISYSTLAIDAAHDPRRVYDALRPLLGRRDILRVGPHPRGES